MVTAAAVALSGCATLPANKPYSPVVVEGVELLAAKVDPDDSVIFEETGHGIKLVMTRLAAAFSQWERQIIFQVLEVRNSL